MNCGHNLKYSGEELAVAISQSLGAISDSKYIAVIARRRTYFAFWATPICCGKSRRQKEGDEIDILQYFNERLRSTMIAGVFTITRLKTEYRYYRISRCHISFCIIAVTFTYNIRWETIPIVFLLDLFYSSH